MATYAVLTRLTPESRSFGHATTETWTALPWAGFESLILG